MADNELDEQGELIDSLAQLIAYNPKLRSEYFLSPWRVLTRAIPRQPLLELFFPGVRGRNQALPRRLGAKVVGTIHDDGRLVSGRESYFEKNAFLNEGLRNPQWTFYAILALSLAAFSISAALVVGAFIALRFGDGTAEKAVLGGLFGGGGAATTLGTFFLMSQDAIRRANGDNAQMRLILTSFATEITHYRAIKIKTLRSGMRKRETSRFARRWLRQWTR